MLEGDEDAPDNEDEESARLQRNAELAAADLPDEGNIDSNVISAAPFIHHQPDTSLQQAAAAVMIG